MKLEIRKCSATEIVHDPRFPALRREYADESAVYGLPDPQEKLEMYQLMESGGALQVYGAFMVGDDGREGLIGFVAVLAPVLPHYGVTIAVTESLFVAAAHRKTGAGLRLIRRAEQHAKEVGSPGLLMSAPSRDGQGGRLATLLPRMGYRETNRVFLKQISYERTAHD